MRYSAPFRGIICGILLAMTCQNFAYCAFSKKDAGTCSAEFLRIPIGARSMAMGQAFVAISDDSSAIYWNPAGMNQVSGTDATLMHTAWFEGITYDWVSFVTEIDGESAFGLGLQYLSYGSIDGYDNTGLKTGAISPSDIAFNVAYSRKIIGCDLGMTVKMISLELKRSASAVAADIGCIYKTYDDKISIGAAVQNMGTKIKFLTAEDSLPVNIKTGVAVNLSDSWITSMDINAPIDNEVYFGAGSEYSYKISKDMYLAGRAGYSQLGKDSGGNGITFGLGVSYSDYRIDYAYVPFGSLGNTQTISIGIQF
ncbi:MAG: PorV/PorQ family protein [Elusimicrobiota bacterium]